MAIYERESIKYDIWKKARRVSNDRKVTGDLGYLREYGVTIVVSVACALIGHAIYGRHNFY